MMIPEKSMIPETQKMNILSNDLVRRISNMKLEQAEEGAVIRIVDQYTGILKPLNMGEVVIAGLVGGMRKRRRRSEQGAGFYRGAPSTIRTKMRKNILDKVNWYKTSDKEVEK